MLQSQTNMLQTIHKAGRVSATFAASTTTTTTTPTTTAGGNKLVDRNFGGFGGYSQLLESPIGIKSGSIK